MPFPVQGMDLTSGWDPIPSQPYPPMDIQRPLRPPHRTTDDLGRRALPPQTTDHLGRIDPPPRTM
ncbi:hypothetical protein, partial [Roseiflexus castenholzii]|uniref:hypothetical protein n=1 Tax=Roseiflexus castenholzii TaxID=120962 RepID=UPI003C7D4A11